MARQPFANPILSVPDPFVTRYEGVYYMMGSTFTNLTIWSSPFLELVAQSATTVWRPLPGDPQFQIWSPSMFLLSHQGKLHWFIYFTASTEDNNESHRIYVLESRGPDPLGPYDFTGRLSRTQDITTIDPSILQIGGELFILFVREPRKNVTHIAHLSDPLTQVGPSYPMIEPDQPWEQGAGSHQLYTPICEGPEALYHDSQTFIVYSASDTNNYNYCLGLLRYNGGSPLDIASWTKSGPVFHHCTPNGVFGPGRASFTTSPDGREGWMVYHAKSSPEWGTIRTTRAQKFFWKADGTPDFGVPVSLATIVSAPSGE